MTDDFVNILTAPESGKAIRCRCYHSLKRVCCEQRDLIRELN